MTCNSSGDERKTRMSCGDDKLISDGMTNSAVDRLQGAVISGPHYSSRERCYVVVVECKKCGKWFEEEIEAARETASVRGTFLCLECDPVAEEPSDLRVVGRFEGGDYL